MISVRAWSNLSGSPIVVSLNGGRGWTVTILFQTDWKQTNGGVEKKISFEWGFTATVIIEMDGNKQMVKNEKTFSDFSSPIPSSPYWFRVNSDQAGRWVWDVCVRRDFTENTVWDRTSFHGFCYSEEYDDESNTD